MNALVTRKAKSNRSGLATVFRFGRRVVTLAQAQQCDSQQVGNFAVREPWFNFASWLAMR
jgi:hypothetical protein